MTPTQAIEKVSDLSSMVGKLAYSIGAECDDIAEQWVGLGLAGGQRDDHAALILGRLRPALRELAKLCERSAAQIDGMVADPFGRKAEAA